MVPIHENPKSIRALRCFIYWLFNHFLLFHITGSKTIRELFHLSLRLLKDNPFSPFIILARKRSSFLKIISFGFIDSESISYYCTCLDRKQSFLPSFSEVFCIIKLGFNSGETQLSKILSHLS